MSKIFIKYNDYEMPLSNIRYDKNNKISSNFINLIKTEENIYEQSCKKEKI